MCAQHFWGFPLYRPLDEKKTLSNASTAIENQTFGAGVTKNIFIALLLINLFQEFRLWNV